MSLKFRIVFASACAVLAALLGLSYADAVKAEAQQERNEAIARYGGDVVGVAVATRQLKAGDEIQEGDLEMRDWVLDLVPEGALTSTDDLVGKRVSFPVAKNAVLTGDCFQEEGAALEVPEGLVGVTIPWSQKLGVTASTSAGTRLVAYEVGKSGSEQIGDSVVVLSRVSAGQGATDAKTVSLAVKGGDVDRILSAAAAGTLSLVQPAEGVKTEDLGSTKVTTSEATALAAAPQVVEGADGAATSQDAAKKDQGSDGQAGQAGQATGGRDAQEEAER